MTGFSKGWFIPKETGIIITTSIHCFWTEEQGRCWVTNVVSPESRSLHWTRQVLWQDNSGATLGKQSMNQSLDERSVARCRQCWDQQSCKTARVGVEAPLKWDSWAERGRLCCKQWQYLVLINRKDYCKDVVFFLYWVKYQFLHFRRTGARAWGSYVFHLHLIWEGNKSKRFYCKL